MPSVNDMAGFFACCNLAIKGVFHTILPTERNFAPYTVKNPTPTPGFVFALRGQGTFLFNGVAYELRPGMALHGSEQMAVSMRTGASELEYMLVRYQVRDSHAGTELGNAAEATCSQLQFVLDPGAGAGIAELLRQLNESFSMPGNMAMLRTGYLFRAVLHEVFSSCLNRAQGQRGAIIERARTYIHQHYMKPLSLPLLAEQHGLNAKAFSYLFHKHTGIFPIQYVIQYRMKRAEELLATSNEAVTIKEIAASVGYEDALYFSRLYKKHFGLPPSKAARN